MISEINSMFLSFLANYEKGIGNTSTAKYSDIKNYVAGQLGLNDEDVYATGATTRVSNFDTRLAQGNQRNQHSPLALTFLKYPSNGYSREEAIGRARDSFLSTSRKFVSGEERGTTYDGILCLIQLDDEQSLEPLVFVYSENCTFHNEVISGFPNIERELVSLVGRSTNQNVMAASTNFSGAGSWKVSADSIETGKNGSVVVFIQNPNMEARYIHPGDAVLILSSTGEGERTSLGRIHHYKCQNDGALMLVLDKFAEVGYEPKHSSEDLKGGSDGSTT